MTCSERPWRGAKHPIDGYFLGDPKIKNGHYEHCAAVLARTGPVYTKIDPSVPLKDYFNNQSNFPSPSELRRLAKALLGDDSEGTVAKVDRWFSERRLKRLLAHQERQAKIAASADRKLQSKEADAIVEQLIQLATPLVVELHAGISCDNFELY